MEINWLRRDGSDRLIIFMLGWAADHRVVEHIRPEGYDIAVVYDYSDGLGDAGLLRSVVREYPHRWLFAWSFGVWAAEQVFGDFYGNDEEDNPLAVAFEKAVAFNGTPFPVSESYGIEPRRMAVTIRGLRSGGTEAFDRRAYGEYFDRMSGVLSPRPIEKNIAELELLARLGAEVYKPRIRWDKAVVGSADVIFPPENMLRYWGLRAEELPLPHYPFAESGIITRELECR